MADRHIHEECGVFGIYSPKRAPLAELTYFGLYALQHRGQESAGIVVNDDGVFAAQKEPGLMGEAFTHDDLRALGEGNISVGHVRYATTGSDNRRNAQPIVIDHHKGALALAHNGNLVNAWELRTSLEEAGCIFHTTSDSEIIAYVIVQERLRHASIEEAVSAAMARLKGAYSLVISSPAKLIAARDEHGFRPLCMGTRADGSTVFASESCALDAVGAKLVREIEPGEIVVVSASGARSIKDHCGKAPHSLCVFEYIYFARPDSIIEGAGVSLARQRAGRFLAGEHPVEADAVIGVPDSGLDAALGYAAASGIPYAIGFTKNKYIGRTFIAPEQSMREEGVDIKLGPIRSAVEGKRIVLIDDSIVRGTTCRRTIEMLRRAGAREIHMRVSAPPFVAPCYYGTDVDSADRLIANHHTVPEIAQIIGADSLGYLSMEHAMQLTGKKCGGFCAACFGGGYPAGEPSAGGKNRFEKKKIHDKKE